MLMRKLRETKRYVVFTEEVENNDLTVETFYLMKSRWEEMGRPNRIMLGVEAA